MYQFSFNCKVYKHNIIEFTVLVGKTFGEGSEHIKHVEEHEEDAKIENSETPPVWFKPFRRHHRHRWTFRIAGAINVREPPIHLFLIPPNVTLLTHPLLLIK